MVILRSLDTKKAIECNRLPTIVLKECAYSLAPSITAIINFSLNKGFQLSGWKKANVPPIFEKGKREFVENYGPVSLLPVIYKVQERCVASHVSHTLRSCVLFNMVFKRSSLALLSSLKYSMTLVMHWTAG